jgi:hypothetical protein
MGSLKAGFVANPANLPGAYRFAVATNDSHETLAVEICFRICLVLCAVNLFENNLEARNATETLTLPG